VKLFQVPRTGLWVELRTRDEHCPPHVHVENEAVPWEARLAFSFIDNAVRLMDVDPIEDAPSTRTIDRIKAAIAACRNAGRNGGPGLARAASTTGGLRFRRTGW
jgi:hypothetical protein